jgi:hypothetical protein
MSWAHIKAILYIEDELKREFYIEEQKYFFKKFGR